MKNKNIYFSNNSNNIICSNIKLKDVINKYDFYYRTFS